MTHRLAVAAICLAGSCSAAGALEQPYVWRDQDTGCAYLLTPQGGVSLRYRRDGLPDCPDAGASSRLAEDATRGLFRGLETLQRELERLRDRFRDQPPADPGKWDL